MNKLNQKDTRPGTIVPNGVILETHEMATVVFLTELGYDIELIPKSNIEGIHTPDIRMSGPFSVADAPYKGVPPLRGLRRYPHAPAAQEHPLFPKASVPVQRV